MKKTPLLFALGFTCLLLLSCQNNGTASLNDETTLLGEENPVLASLDETQLDETLESIDLIVDEAIEINASLLRSASADSNLYLTDCPVITVNTDVSPHLMTMDFGTSCTGKDGRVRSGKILVTSTSLKTYPSVRQKTFEAFMIDGRRIEGTVSKTISRDSAKLIRTATIQENVLVIRIESADSLLRVTNITRQYQRNNPTDKRDDEILTWGSTVTTKANGIVVTKTIAETTPLLKPAIFKHVVSGIATFENSKGKSWSIDFGDGTYDNKAILTTNGTSKEIRLR